MKRIVAIGGGGASMFSCIVATQLKKEKFRAIMISDEEDIYCRCTTPYILTNNATLKDAIQPDSMVTDFGVEIVKDKALSIDVNKKQVRTKKQVIDYDYLVIGTGASPFVPPIEGVEHEKVFTVRTTEDVKRIQSSIKNAKEAVVIGGGIIGVEMASALTENNIKTSIVEFCDQLLPNITDNEFATKIEAHLKKNGVKTYLKSEAKSIDSNPKTIKTLTIKKDGKQKSLNADIIIVAAGVRANLDVIRGTGIKSDRRGILVDEKMRTNIKDVYACGDCCVSKSVITDEHSPSQLASTAIQQAKVVGYQIAGFPIKYGGNTAAFAFQFLGKEYAGAGLTEAAARKKYKIVTTGYALTTDIYRDMKDKKDLVVKLIFAGPLMRLVGVEAYGNGVTGHVETASFAMSMKANIFKLLKYNYIAHPSLTPWPFMNPLIMAAEDAMGKAMTYLKSKIRFK
ncbi:hypothetical protein BVX95_02140 [archaeon D22]|nr:hypothetical protein BVX95_02140 [archaeon D22]